MRVLIRPGPDIDIPVVEETPFVTDRTIMIGPSLDDEIDRLPLPLVHAHGIAVGRQHLIGHAAHKSAFEPSL